MYFTLFVAKKILFLFFWIFYVDKREQSEYYIVVHLRERKGGNMKFDLNRLRAERIAKGLTQAQLAKAIDISKNAYWRKENGQRNFSMEEFLRILEVLGFSKNNVSLFFKQDVDKREQKGEKLR